MTVPSSLLQIEDLCVHFNTQEGVVRAVDGVSLSLEAGQTLAVVGESGSGKSTLALAIMGLVPESAGTVMGGDVRLEGVSILGMTEKERRAVRGDRIAMVFQEPTTSLNPVYRVGRQVAEPLRVHKSMGRARARLEAVELLRRVGIPEPESRVRCYPHEFSGGMCQRAVIAMAVACEPEVLIADEPMTALDMTTQAQILELLKEIRERSGTAILLVTHDLGVVADMADHVLVMYAGRVVEYGTVEDVFYRPLHPYTWGLLQSLPGRDTQKKSSLRPIAGQPPGLSDLSAGCVYSPRCPLARPECTSGDPVAAEVRSGHRSSCLFAGDRDFFAGLGDLPGQKRVDSKAVE
jgi:oligopeptide transport system ATP-binding protein